MKSKLCASGIHQLRTFTIVLVAALCGFPPLPAQAYDDILGDLLYYRAEQGVDLYDIARHFDVGIGELRAANPSISLKPEPEKIIALPTAHIIPKGHREGIIINLAERRLYHFPDPESVSSFPITIGKEGWETPTGETFIMEKRRDPVWIPPDSIRAENPSLLQRYEPGPNNPLGKYALNLGWPGFRIHGTNNPSSIGRQSSHGCIRMYPEDIESLFNAVEVNTKVVVVNEPYKTGWRNGVLFLEVSPPSMGSTARSISSAAIREALRREAGFDSSINWDTVAAVLKWRDGIPTAVAFPGVIASSASVIRTE